VTLKVEAPSAEGVKVAVPLAVKAPFNDKAPSLVWLLDPTLIGADRFSLGGLAVGVTQAPLAIKVHIRIRDKAQPLIAIKRNELFFCSMIFY